MTQISINSLMQELENSTLAPAKFGYPQKIIRKILFKILKPVFYNLAIQNFQLIQKNEQYRTQHEENIIELEILKTEIHALKKRLQ